MKQTLFKQELEAIRIILAYLFIPAYSTHFMTLNRQSINLRKKQ